MESISIPDCEYQVRWMQPRDMLHLLDIDRECYVKQLTEDRLHGYISSQDGLYIPYVGHLDGEIVGYCLVHELPLRNAIVRIGVRESCRRRRVARAMVTYVQRRSILRQVPVTAIVHERDLARQLFFRACRFECIKTVKMKDGDDAYKFIWE